METENFLKEQSVFKNKIRQSQSLLKTNDKVSRKTEIIKVKMLKRVKLKLK